MPPIWSYIKQRWTSYYRASLFLPRNIREDVILLYAFVRIVDNIVDAPMGKDPNATNQQKKETFTKFRTAAMNTFCNNSTTRTDSIPSEWETVIQGMHKLIQKKEIPLIYIADFFEAMHADTAKERYATYQDLQHYMKWSALAIGRIMNRIVGVQSEHLNAMEEANAYGDKLAEAMQYTNILRDVLEDYTIYGRIYLTQDRLTAFWLSHKEVISLCNWTMKPTEPSWQKYMTEQVNLTKDIYAQSYPGIQLLNPSCQKAIFLSGKLYEAILDKIIANKYDVFSKSARTSKREKCKAVLPNILKHDYSH